jgi:AraC-like DNA-binding protein
MLLHKAFCKLFFVTPAQFQFHHRMFKALAMAANSTASIDEIATEYGMTAKAFSAHFVSYYNCSIETLRKNQ